MRIVQILICLLALCASGRGQTISLVNTGLVGNLRPPISESGQIAYQSGLANGALYLGRPGAPVQMVIATNGPIAGSPPYSFVSLTTRPFPNGTNQVAFYDGSGGGGLFANFNGTLYRVAVRSNQVPGLAAGVLYMTGSGTSFDYLGAGGFAMNSNGVFAFNSELTGTGVNTTNNRVIVKGHPTNLTVIARAGSPAAGFPPGCVFQRDVVGGGINGPVYINGSGRAAFIAAVGPTNSPNDYTNCIWFHDAQGLRPAILFDARFPPQIGTPAPDAAPGARFNQFWYVNCRLNDAGEIAFYALAMNPVFAGTTGIWSGPTNNLRLIMYHDMVAPGTGGATVSDLDFNRFYLGNNGTLALVANLTGAGVVASNNTALYLGSNTNNLQLIARKGMQAPGCPAGVYFSSLNNSDVSDPVLFGNNRLAFGGTLVGPGVTSDNRLGLWATDTNGVLQLVFRCGETLLEVRPGIFRTINTFFYNGGTGQDGRPASVNRKGQLSMDVTVNGAPDLSANYILDLTSAGSGGGSGTSSFTSWQNLPGTGFQLSLTVQSGKAYRVQRTLSLNPTNWATLTNFTSAGPSAQCLDPAPASPLSVYRVVSP